MALLEAQLSQLRTEKHFLLNSVVNSQKKDEVIQILVDQLKYNAPRQYLIETAAHIRKISTTSNHSHPEANQHRTRDKDIDRICNMLEAPIDLVRYLVPYLNQKYFFLLSMTSLTFEFLLYIIGFFFFVSVFSPIAEITHLILTQSISRISGEGAFHFIFQACIPPSILLVDNYLTNLQLTHVLALLFLFDPQP